MTDEEVQRFVEQYRSAFEHRDPHAIAALFDVPSSIVTDRGTGMFTTREAIVDNIRHLLDHYTAAGLTGVRLRSLDIRRPNVTMAQADVSWTLVLEDGELRFSTWYWLVARNGTPLIGSVLSHGERAAFEAHGG